MVRDKEKRKEYSKNYYKKHFKKIKNRVKQRYQKIRYHPEEYKQYLEKSKIYCKRGYQKHKEKRLYYKKVYNTEYYKSVVGRYNGLKSSAKSRNKMFSISKNNFISWYNNQSGYCIYCGTGLKSHRGEGCNHFNSISIDRKDNTKGYDLNNIVLCCLSCNHIKGRYFSFEEMKVLGKTITKIRNQRKR